MAQRKPGPRIVSDELHSDSPPPHDEPAELAVLGAVVLDGKAFPRFESLRSWYFFNDANKKIFAAACVIQGRDEQVGYVTLLDELRSRGELESVGGEYYISKLGDGLPVINQADQAAEIVRRTWLQRSLIRVLANGLKKVHDIAPGDPLSPVDPVSAYVAAELRQVGEEFHGLARHGDDDAVRDLSLPDMPEACLDGFLGNECAERLVSQDFPIAYAWPAVLAVAGTMVPPTPNVPTNLNCALVGPVASGKTTCIEMAIRLLNLTPPRLQSVMAGSAEGLFADLENAGGDGRLISVDELAHLLLKAAIDGASFPSLLNRAFGETEFDLIVRRGKKFHVNCRLGIIGGVVEDSFQGCFTAATTAGLWDRFIFGQCPRPHEYHFRPFEGAALDLEPCDVRIDPEVFEAAKDWKKENPSLADGRPVELAIRAATIAAAFGGNSVLRAKHLGPARAFAEYQSRVRLLLKPNPGENRDAQCAFMIMSVLDSAGGAWLSRSELNRKIHGTRFGPGVFRHALDNLQFNGEIEVVTQGKLARIRRINGGGATW